MRYLTKTSLRTNEDGMAAIILTMFFMFVMTLTVLSFSQVARREERQALDNQLSSQAFYAAEAGINQVVKDLATGNLPNPIPTGCIPKYSNTAYTATSEAPVSSSCVTIDDSPTSLQYGVVDTEKGVSTVLEGTAGLSNVTFKWHDTDGGNRFSSCVAPASVGQLSGTSPDPCDAGDLRLQMTPVGTTPFSRQQLINSSYTVFLRPTNSSAAASTAYAAYSGGADTQGKIVGGSCNSTDGVCSVTISLTGLPAGKLYINMRSIYKDNSVEITGADSASGEADFVNAQTLIDSTGKANDVLKRLQVRIPAIGSVYRPNFTLDTKDSICKRLMIYQRSAVISDPSISEASCQIN